MAKIEIDAIVRGKVEAASEAEALNKIRKALKEIDKDLDIPDLD